MSQVLFDVNLQQLPDEFLTGVWRVASRVLNQTDPASLMACAEQLALEPGRVRVECPDQQDQGSWEVLRDELLNRPYLALELGREQTRALVTRLRRSRTGSESHLNLYFQSGMEMQLTQA
ncbi:hypothetical protein [Hymenobacter actinosclerus]|uniref:Uncharacterized protein n=1 Tax=Hymenobacter actinosclerus TaxID=82805 RepID=A0A1I0GPW9_9BACT|nr:hypothetical protein [Hymenobacter actinosclerus]SET73120.1 hypothetical protein SAMN04487998_2522 [Hymenobacter actinosclerus]